MMMAIALMVVTVIPAMILMFTDKDDVDVDVGVDCLHLTCHCQSGSE